MFYNYYYYHHTVYCCAAVVVVVIWNKNNDAHLLTKPLFLSILICIVSGVTRVIQHCSCYLKYLYIRQSLHSFSDNTFLPTAVTLFSLNSQKYSLCFHQPIFFSSANSFSLFLPSLCIYFSQPFFYFRQHFSLLPPSSSIYFTQIRFSTSVNAFSPTFIPKY